MNKTSVIFCMSLVTLLFALLFFFPRYEVFDILKACVMSLMLYDKHFLIFILSTLLYTVAIL